MSYIKQSILETYDLPRYHDRQAQKISERRLGALRAVSHTIWSGEVDGWHEGDHLARAVEQAGGDLAEMDQLDAAQATQTVEGQIADGKFLVVRDNVEA